MIRKLTTPLSREDVLSLRAGDQVLLSGAVYTARDAAHLRLVEAMERGEALPLPLEGQVIYYAGPTPTPAGAPLAPLALPHPSAWMHIPQSSWKRDCGA